MNDIIVIGGGLAGLVSAIALRKAGYQVIVIEKKTYPFHRVCGEYISNEVKPYLVKNNLFPDHLAPTQINQFWLTANSGNKAVIPLRMGAFGISRYALDLHLYQQAKAIGVEFHLKETVSEVIYNNQGFDITTLGGKELQAKFVIGAFGKRSVIDKKLNRNFIQRKSPYIGVKYHIKTEFPNDVIALHNFSEGYCGLSKIEGDRYNLCYLSHQKNLRTQENISEMEENILWQNPHLKSIFQNSDFLFDRPEVINEISFEKKHPIENHILMAGDAAGLITPLCGNGMAMAIHAGKILSDILINNDLKNRELIENTYLFAWEKMFRNRLWTGKKIQHLFGSPTLSNFAVSLAKYTRPIASFMIEKTHGKPF